MSYNLTITAVAPNPREWGNNYGTFKDYTVTVKNEASGNTRDVSWSRKIRDDGTVSVPQVGDSFEADMVPTEFPPNWKLKNVKFGDGGPSTSATNGRSSWTGPQQDQGEFRRSREQMTIEAADHTAALLLLANVINATAGENGYNWTNGEFESLSTYLQARATLGAKTEPAPQALPENRKDIERTGESDIPAPQQQEFDHPPIATVEDTDPIPF